MVLLRTVAMGWQQEAVTNQAAEVQRLGKQLYTRLGTMAEHFNRIGSSLDKAVDAFNSTLNSIDSRVMVTARKLGEIGVVSPTTPCVPDPTPVSTRSRHAVSPETPPEQG
jgi:Uncharacterized protein conserved in bacteria